MKDELLQVAQQVAPPVLLRIDKTEYYRDSDIPCLCVRNGLLGDETYMIGEKRDTKVYGNKVVSLVTNTIPMCLRYEPYVINSTILVVTHCKDNSWFKWNNPREGHDYDTRCKKIAWGIAAYIGRYCWIDEAGELDWASGTIEDIYRTYHDEATRLIKLMSRDYDRAYRHKDIQTMQRVGNEIEAQHIQQEAAYIEQSNRVGELLGEPVLEAAKGYITWLQGRDKPQPSQDVTEPLQELKSILPCWLNDEAVKAFQRMIDKGMWRKVQSRLERVEGKCSKAQLAYFLGNYLKPDGIFPDREYSVIFGESRLGKALTQLIDNKEGKPKGYEIIDKIREGKDNDKQL